MLHHYTGRALSLIIADDHPVFRSGMMFALHSIDPAMPIREATNGGEVLRLLRQEHADVVFMDIRMGPPDGIETTRLVREQFPDTHVIALTMFDDAQHLTMMKDAGALGFLTKSVERSELETALGYVMEGKYYLAGSLSHLLLDQSTRKRSTASSAEQALLSHPRYREIAFLVAHNIRNDTIAEALNLSPRTVESHLKKMLELCPEGTTIGLVKWVMELGLLKDPVLAERFKHLFHPSGKS